MSAPEVASKVAHSPLELRVCHADVIEIAARRGRTRAVAGIVAERGMSLPAIGHAGLVGAGLSLCVRPERWLFLLPQAAAGVRVGDWQHASAGEGAVIDRSSGFALLHLAGASVREILARGCRLDLEAARPGYAAATIMAQIPILLVALRSGLLLLSPSSLAAHLREWLVMTAQPHGIKDVTDLIITDIIGGKL